MKKNISFVSLLIIHLCLAKAVIASGGYDALRIENEIKLTVPNRLSDSVWKYLKIRYDNNNLYLNEIDSAFNCEIAVELFIDQYFDNEKLSLLNMNNGIRYRTRFILTDPSHRKHGRQLMQVKINNVGNSKLSRGEYKYKIEHYDNHRKTLDNHPFLGLVKRKHRKDLINRLEKYSIKGRNLFPTIKITQVRKRIYVYKGTAPFATLTLDNVTSTYKEKDTTFTELEMELSENKYTESDSLTRKKMENVNEIIKSDILNQFPTIEQNQTPKYSKAATKLELTKNLSVPGKEKVGISAIYWVIGGILFLLSITLLIIYKKKEYNNIFIR